MNRYLLGACLLASSLSLAVSSGLSAQEPEPAEQFLAMGTSTPGGSMFPLGGAMAKVIQDAYPQLQVSIEATGGSTDNINLLGNEQVDLGMTTTNLAYFATKGEPPFDQAITNFGGILAGHGNVWQMYTLKDSGITSIADLKGKSVSLGAPGSIVNSIGQEVIEAHGLQMGDDWSPEYLAHADGPGALRDGRVDAVIIISSVPVSAVTDITSTHGDDVVFVNPDPEVLASMIEERPYWTPIAITGGAYQGHDQDIPGSFTLKTVLLAANALDEATVYAITKALIENNDALSQAHSLGKAWGPANAVEGIKGVFPFHPGAEKYLKEAGLL
jgi:TRAP transporter TAXI family solute receptor